MRSQHGLICLAIHDVLGTGLHCGSGSVEAHFPFSGPMGVAMSWEETGPDFPRSLTFQSPPRLREW